MPDKRHWWDAGDTGRERAEKTDEKSSRYGKQAAKVTTRPSISKQHGPQTHRKG